MKSTGWLGSQMCTQQLIERRKRERERERERRPDFLRSTGLVGATTGGPVVKRRSHRREREEEEEEGEENKREGEEGKERHKMELITNGGNLIIYDNKERNQAPQSKKKRTTRSRKMNVDVYVVC